MDMGDAFAKLEEQVLNLKEENERLKWYHRICIGDLIQIEKERDRLFGKTELLQKKLDISINCLEKSFDLLDDGHTDFAVDEIEKTLEKLKEVK